MGQLSGKFTRLSDLESDQCKADKFIVKIRSTNKTNNFQIIYIYTYVTKEYMYTLNIYLNVHPFSFSLNTLFG